VTSAIVIANEDGGPDLVIDQPEAP